MKVGVLASGSGSNLQALVDAEARGELGPARLVVVGANVPGCRALARAEAAGLPSFLLDHKTFPSREAFDAALASELGRHGVELVVLAGFMRLLGPAFLGSFTDRVINIHPALLPAFPGVHAQRQAFEHGVKLAGCTTHFVDGGTDTGPIIAQAVVPVLDGDDADSLSQRILAEEHRLLPATVRALAEGRVRLEGRRVFVSGAPPASLAAARLCSLL
jgi:phosphoribosylglycinamide formyltransferase 1